MIHRNKITLGRGCAFQGKPWLFSTEVPRVPTETGRASCVTAYATPLREVRIGRAATRENRILRLDDGETVKKKLDLSHAREARGGPLHYSNKYSFGDVMVGSPALPSGN